MHLWTIIIAALLLFIVSGFRIAREYERGVIFRLGRYQALKGPGLYWIIPFVDTQAMVDLRTNTVEVEQQETITKDSVTVKINAVLWYKISDPVKAIIAVQNYQLAVYQVALTSLRNIIGQHLLDEVLKERDTINSTLLKIIDEATEPWGIKVELIEMKDVEIPDSMQRVMAMEAEAIREKRARLIKADAECEASQKLSEASKIIADHPLALELRRMQMVQEIGADKNTTTVVLMPSDLITLSGKLNEYLSRK